MKYKFRFYVDHIKGIKNELADALSRLQINKFKSLAKKYNKTFDPAPLIFKRIAYKLGDKLTLKFKPIEYNDSE